LLTTFGVLLILIGALTLELQQRTLPSAPKLLDAGGDPPEQSVSPR
jgi:hypothetical protein